MTTTDRTASDHPVRLSLAADLRGDVDGAWWPYTAVARELPFLVDALADRLGSILDISVNWSSLEGTPDLNSQPARGPLPGQKARHKRVIAVTGADAQANLLVIPPHTSRALAVMILRHAARLPIQYRHQDSTAYRAAEEIVLVARTEYAQRVDDRR